MKANDCYIGQRVSQFDVSDIMYREGTVKAQGLILNDYNGLVPSAQVEWDDCHGKLLPTDWHPVSELEAQPEVLSNELKKEGREQVKTWLLNHLCSRDCSNRNYVFLGQEWERQCKEWDTPANAKN